MRRTFIRKSEKGQTWVIMAVAITVLIIVLGFAVDSAVLFSNYTKLKRAVDAAAVSAANEYKVKNSKVFIDDPVDLGMLRGYLTAAAQEMLVMHDLDVSKIDLHVYICDDANIQNLAPALYAMCPAAGQTPRKLVYVQASEEAPTYFLTLIGINSIPLTTYSISEAAPIDLVLVFDTSESMGVNSPGYVPDNFNPAVCNSAINPDGTIGNCEPLRTAKIAATNLVKTLFNGYDQVAVVSFAQVPVLYRGLTKDLTDDSAGALNAINNIQLHDDAPALLLNSNWYSNNLLNPSDPEDRDGDGMDADTPPCNVTPVDIDGNYDPNPAHLADPQYWLDQDKDNYLQRLSNPSIPFVPCDRGDRLDAFDWNQDGMEDASDVAASNAWIGLQPHEYCSNYAEDGTCVPGYWQTLPMSILSTCTGCGIRMATNELVIGGRSNSVWVMVLLSDGVANLTDTPTTFPLPNPFGIPTSYPDGYCGGSIDNPLWSDLCLKPSSWPRYCINPTLIPTPPATAVAPGDVCPPGSTTVGNPPSVSPPYNPADYARDMADRAALLHGSIAETKGSDMSIYTIGLGPFAVDGEALLRYIADIGDDGTRDSVYSGSQGCASYSTDYKECGQYYFTRDANKLGTIFDSIASRIYTKITY
jgi:hypothetical protein